MTDATGCPGIWFWCFYTGSDLYNDSAHPCKQRTGGDRNWEAWIKDSRDDELYRIVLMPDNKWWLAQNVKYAATGSSVTISGCTPDKCGRAYTGAQANGAWGGSKTGIGANVQGVCPAGWILPLNDDATSLLNSISADIPTVCQRLRPLDSGCGNIEDYYGWANIIGWHYQNSKYGVATSWKTNDNNGLYSAMCVDCGGNCKTCCNQYDKGYQTYNQPAWNSAVRCLRQL
jgi:uncharacterized protein (TIGR02145 family)